MRIAERLCVQKIGVLAHLRRRMQTRAGVIQIDVAMLVQSPVLDGTKRVEMQRGPILEDSARETLRTRFSQLRPLRGFSDPHVIVIAGTLDRQVRAEYLAQMRGA